jgi:hypothetical protein
VKWISVKDELPKQYDMVLISHYKSLDIMQFHKKNQYCCGEMGKKEDHFSQETLCCPFVVLVSNVEYWCHLDDIPLPTEK